MRIGISVAAIVLLTLIALGAYPKWRRYVANKTAELKEAEARKELAFESLTERLPKGKPIAPTKALDAESKKRWEILDGKLARYQDERAELLKALHEKTRKFFVESPGEGSGRIIRIPWETLLMDNWNGTRTARQPGEPADFPVSPGESLSRVEPDSELYFYHEWGLNYFLHPSGFGFVKDRGHVAGFKPHGFRSSKASGSPARFGVPAQERVRWRIDYIQLVGILSQAEPVIYLTDKLPSMDQVRQGKTRTLDFFEEAALPSLRDGEDLYIVRKDDTLRMLGALRATKTCQKCHDAEIGDLLGAFSYTLRLASNEKKEER